MIIVVNNPAAKESGALTILENFLKKVSALKCNHKFYCFVCVNSLKKYETKNLKIIVIQKQNFRQRILWDNFGLKNYLKEKNIDVDLFISLQNTGVNIKKDIPQLLYFHQAIPLSDKKWNFLKKEERIYWFYKNIYGYFIKQYLNRIDNIFVQTNWIKESFSKKFNYNKEKIIVEKPVINLPEVSKIRNIEKEKFRVFYPATPLIYKNHKVIIETMNLLKKGNKNIDKELECIFTFSKGENKEIDFLIKKYNLDNVIKLIGKISYEEVLENYKSSDLMIFPSYIETLGLPLLEAKLFNLNIIASNLPYAREVVGDYSNIEYFEYNNYKELKNKIKEKKSERKS